MVKQSNKAKQVLPLLPSFGFVSSNKMRHKNSTNTVDATYFSLTFFQRARFSVFNIFKSVNASTILNGSEKKMLIRTLLFDDFNAVSKVTTTSTRPLSKPVHKIRPKREIYMYSRNFS